MTMTQTMQFITSVDYITPHSNGCKPLWLPLWWNELRA